MKRLAALLLLALAGCGACSTRTTSLAEPAAVPEHYPIALIGRFGAAHACVVDQYIVTAGHVAYQPTLVDGQIMEVALYYAWEDAAGRRGWATPYRSNIALDLALLSLDGPDTAVERNARATADAVPGDTVYWYEYDFRNIRGAYRPRRRAARVINVRAWHIFLDEEPTEGASGSCVFNTVGEVLGVISWGQQMEDLRSVGAAVSIRPLPTEGL